MSTPSAGSLRARVRAELTDQIKAVARRHLGVDGADLSLRAVARELGMVSSAVYRYFPSRDDLLTALILDAYNDIGAAGERADAAVPRTDLTGRYLAVCRATRHWALAHPHEYALIYGSPVPGYAAPPDTVDPAQRTVAVLAAILRDGYAGGALTVPPGERMPRQVRADLTRVLADPRFAGAPAALLARGMTAWAALFGLISFELFGRFETVISARDAYFEHQCRLLARFIGLP